MNPFNPVICIVICTVLKVPISSRICETAKRIVCCFCVASPSRQGYTKSFDITGIRREVDSVDVRVNRMLDGLLDAIGTEVRFFIRVLERIGHAYLPL